MVLTFCGQNYSLLQVTNATPEEMAVIKQAVTEKVNRYVSRKYDNWNGDVSMCWWVEPYFYIPAACWKRIDNLRYPDEQSYRPAYVVEFRDADKFFNMSIDRDTIADFVATLHPAFSDIEDQITVLWTMLQYRMSSHCISTGFGKTYVCYLLAQYTKQILDGKTLLITPRVALVEQGIADMHNYMQTIEASMHLKCYGICGGFANNCAFEDADLYIGTYQSIVNMPEDMFHAVTTVIADEGHSAKAISVRDSISKCKNAQIVTAISGTMQYVSGADALTIEQFCGPMITNYPAYKQIEKGRLPRIAMQQIILQHTDGKALYQQMLEQQRLPAPTTGYPPELASTYRPIEMQYLGTNLHLLNYILQLCKMLTDQGKNVLVIFKHRQPTVNLFELAKANGQKCHLIFGSTPRQTRAEIKQQIETEHGWILVATDGVFAMGVSINNLHGLIISMIGHSPHVVLQSIGRMLRNHPDKFDVTVCYDIVNDFRQIGTSFDYDNGKERKRYYEAEQHPCYPVQTRLDINY